MARHLFWVSDGAWAAIEPHLPHGRPGKPRGGRSHGDLRHPARAEDRMPAAIDSSHVKVHRSAAGSKRGSGTKRTAARAVGGPARSTAWPMIAADRSRLP